MGKLQELPEGIFMEIEDEVTMGEMDHDGALVKQAIEFLRGAFDNLWTYEGLAQMAYQSPNQHTWQVHLYPLLHLLQHSHL